VRWACALLVLLIACDPPAPKCQETSGWSRTEDFHQKGKGDTNLVVVSLDTEPTMGSSLFQSALDHFGYEYYLLGSKSAAIPYPVKNGIFKLEIFGYRTARYREAIDRIIAEKGPRAVIILSDAGDVLVTRGPQDILEAFKKSGKEILFTAEMGCCNVNILPYVEKIAKDLGIDNVRSSDPRIVSIVSQIAKMVPVMGTSLGYGNEPVYLWSPEAKRILALMRQVPLEPHGPATQYRYLNAGGIIGYAGALKQALSDLPSSNFYDDQEGWSLWYGEIGYPQGKAILDYQQSLFAMVNEIKDLDGLIRALFDDFSILPHGKDFIFNTDNVGAGFFHCAGCSQQQMRSFRQQIVNGLKEKNIFTTQQREFVDQC